jgi:predicted lipoprotein with Yx(FWY)xxD motif
MITDAQIPSQARPAFRRGARGSLTAVAAVAVVGLIAAACGSSTPSASSTTTTNASPGASPSSTTAPTNAQVVANGMSNAKIGSTILVNPAGRTLYQLSADSATTSVCTGMCATYWPPVTVPSGSTPKAGTGAGGRFGTITRSDGTLQVTYNGHPLYTFAGDTSAGSTSGQGIKSFGGTWTVVTAASTSPTSPTQAPTTTKPAGGGYGY